MKVCIITANMGNMDKDQQPVEQSIPTDFYKFNDENFLPRVNALSSRLQARIPKIFGWQMIPGYDYYIWIDSSFTIKSPDTAKWFVEQCEQEDIDMVFFKHPERNSLKEEADFIKEKLKQRNYYLYPRYHNEIFDEMLAEMYEDKTFIDNLLIADAEFVYKNTSRLKEFAREWWYWTSRYNVNDQFGLSYALHKTKIKYKIINQHYLYTDYMTYTRGKWRK